MTNNMSLEKALEKNPQCNSNIFSVEEISKEIKKNGFFRLPKGEIFMPSIDVINPRTKETREVFFRTYLAKRDLMLGGIHSYNGLSASTFRFPMVGLYLTSPEIIKTEREYKEWFLEIPQKYGIPPEYYEEDPSEIEDPAIDTLSFIEDDPELQTIQTSILDNISSLRKEVDSDFFNELGIELDQTYDYKNVIINLQAKEEYL